MVYQEWALTLLLPLVIWSMWRWYPPPYRGDNKEQTRSNARLGADTANLRADIAVLSADIAELSADNVILCADATKLGADIPDILSSLSKKRVNRHEFNMDCRPDIAKNSKLCNDINEICGVIGILCPDIAKFRTDASKVCSADISRQTHADVDKLSLDISELRTDISEIRTHIAELRTHIAELRVDIAKRT
jgi:cell division protein FtsB